MVPTAGGKQGLGSDGIIILPLHRRQREDTHLVEHTREPTSYNSVQSMNPTEKLRLKTRGVSHLSQRKSPIPRILIREASVVLRVFTRKQQWVAMKCDHPFYTGGILCKPKVMMFLHFAAPFG